MADSKPLIFIRQLKKFLGEDPDGYSNNDDIYLSAILTTTTLFETIVGYSFTKQTYTEYLDGFPNDRKLFHLGAFPVDTVAAVKVFLYQDSSDYIVELDNSLYTINYDEGTLEIKTPCLEMRDSIKVEYTAGYTASTDVDIVDDPLDPTLERSLGLHIPEMLKNAALQQSAQFSSFLQASVCTTNSKKPNALSSSKSFRSAFNLNDTAMLFLTKYVNRRRKVRMI